MNATAVISTSLLLLQLVLDAAIKNNAADAIIQSIQAAIQQLQAVQGSDVTWQQLNDLRVKPTF